MISSSESSFALRSFNNVLASLAVLVTLFSARVILLRLSAKVCEFGSSNELISNLNVTFCLSTFNTNNLVCTVAGISLSKSFKLSIVKLICR